jgi:hypothetical protein
LSGLAVALSVAMASMAWFNSATFLKLDMVPNQTSTLRSVRHNLVDELEELFSSLQRGLARLGLAGGDLQVGEQGCHDVYTCS